MPRRPAISALLAFTLASPLIAQRATTPPLPNSQAPSKINAFLTRKGTLILRTYHAIGSIAINDSVTLSVKALTASHANVDQTRFKAVYFDMGVPSAQIDLDEAESFSRSLGYAIDMVNRWSASPPADRTTITFSGDDGFEFHAMWYDNRIIIGLQMDNYSTNPSVPLSAPQLTTLKKLVDDSINYLQSN